MTETAHPQRGVVSEQQTEPPSRRRIVAQPIDIIEVARYDTFASSKGTKSVDGTDMRDSDIRTALRSRLACLHAGDRDTLIVEELGLSQGAARVDVAVINGEFIGYEIKSDRDTLVRLPKQRLVYSECFDRITIVVGSRHVSKALSEVPDWWGVTEAISGTDPLKRVVVPDAERNPRVQSSTIIKLLWKSEVAAILEKLSGPVPRRLTRDELWSQLVECVSDAELREHVRETLKLRGDWRSGPSPFRCGDSSRSSARSLHSPANREWLLSRKSQRPRG